MKKKKLSSQLWNIKSCFLKNNEATASKFAEEPEFTITAYLLPIYLANSYSNCCVISSMVILPESITSIPFKISFVENASSIKGYKIFLDNCFFEYLLIKFSKNFFSLLFMISKIFNLSVWLSQTLSNISLILKIPCIKLHYINLE